MQVLPNLKRRLVAFRAFTEGPCTCRLLCELSKETRIWQTPPFSASTRVESIWRTQLTFYTRLAFGTRILPCCFQRTRAPRTLVTRGTRKLRSVQFLAPV